MASKEKSSKIAMLTRVTGRCRFLRNSTQPIITPRKALPYKSVRFGPMRGVLRRSLPADRGHSKILIVREKDGVSFRKKRRRQTAQG